MLSLSQFPQLTQFTSSAVPFYAVILISAQILLRQQRVDEEDLRVEKRADYRV